MSYPHHKSNEHPMRTSPPVLWGVVLRSCFGVGSAGSEKKLHEVTQKGA